MAMDPPPGSRRISQLTWAELERELETLAGSETVERFRAL
jgi:hypothetical protein